MSKAKGKTVKQPNVLKDTLHYTAPSCANTERAQGVVVGVIGTIMAIKGCDYEEAVEIVKEHMPHAYKMDAIPEAFRDSFEKGQ